MSNNLKYIQSSILGFGDVDGSADSLHGKPADPHHSVTETIWFEVLVPNANLIAHFYIYMRPNLGICSAGAWIWKGFPATPFQMDHLNYQAALPMPIENGATVSVPQVNLQVEILEPLKKIKFSYRPADQNTWAELTATAVMPPAMRGNGKHFNQFMRYEGEIVLNGERITVNDLSIRDRSWHEPRIEDPVSAPKTAWMSGITLDERTAFNLVGNDDPSKGVEWEGIYPITPESALYDGWIYNGRDLLRIVSMSKKSERNPKKGMAPTLIAASFEDAAGGKHELIGRPTAAGWISTWPNIHVWLPMMDWELDGEKATGDAQEYCWGDYARRFYR